MSEDTACWLCGRNPAEGLAYWQDHRLCHGDRTNDAGETCYDFVTRTMHRGELAAATSVAMQEINDEIVRIFSPIAHGLQRALARMTSRTPRTGA